MAGHARGSESDQPNTSVVGGLSGVVFREHSSSYTSRSRYSMRLAPPMPSQPVRRRNGSLEIQHRDPHRFAFLVKPGHLE